MKIYTLLLFVTMAKLFAIDANGQNVTINVNNKELRTVFNKIEKKTKFNFFYNNSLVDVTKKVSLSADNQDLNEVLTSLFKRTNIDYRFLKNQIILFPKNDKSVVKVIEDLINNENLDKEIETIIKDVLQNEIKGTVVDEKGIPLAGVNIIIQGTSTGVQSNFDGEYRIQANNGAVLKFSYIGFKTQTITVGDSNTINVTMEEDASQLDEVVVTALGIKRQKKSLTYATQNVDVDGIDEARPNQNLVNSLSGKIAGVSIQRSGNGVSGSSKVVLRGNRSIAGSSQALYIVDGVPLGGDISDLSPDDVQSINVLKGANAAALYGARANNGAIIITTKSGSEDRLSVDFSSTITTETGNILFDYQNQYGQGSGGTYNPASLGSWGSSLDGSSVANWSPDPNNSANIPYAAQSNNVDDFHETGVSFANNISVRSGSAKNQTFFGYTNENKKGIVPGNELQRHNVSLKIDNKLIDDKLKLSAKVNYIRTKIDNQLDTGESFANPWRHAYRLPRNIRTSDVSVFQYVDAQGDVRQNYWDPGNNGGANPYWTINKNLNEIVTNRVIGYGSLTYNITDDLSILARTAVDQNNTFREDKDHNDSYIIADNGEFLTYSFSQLEWNTDFLLSYNKKLSDDFSFNANLGGNHRIANAKFVRTTNGGLNAANIFAISNAQNLTAEHELSRREVNSLYAFSQLAFKDAVFLDLTYRSDWSSTLPEANRRFDYYSVGLSAVLSDLLELPEAFSYLKLRTSYAEVGNDTDPFGLSRTANLIPGGFIQLSNSLPNPNLKPERTKSFEVGFDARFLDSRLGIDFTYYKTNSIDQLFGQQVSQASGVSTRFINGADIQNSGVELILTGNPIRTPDFNWNITVNFSKNDSEILALADGLETLSFGGDFFRRFELNVGEEWGNVYSRGFARDAQGRVLVAADGTPEVTSGQDVLVANFNPDWLGGIYNSFTYKNFNLSFLIDIRQGGEIGSFTNAVLSSDGALAKTLVGRDGSLVFGSNIFSGLEVVKADGTPNDIQVNAEQFWAKIGGRNSPVGEAFSEDASNIRMREITLGYSFPQSLLDKTPFKKAKISLVGRNLFFISNNASVDPEVITSPNSANLASNTSTNTNEEVRADGFESFAPPSTRSIGLNLKIGF
ncbi:SusC/RagA family TonB-linked outer membrane protein [Flavivirga spongiicola]|uniref:SusC/RagA family TonB-linked outer membrane protein n=1 Tax=Flavivirga spongiicola TaxID=421621 RepID=A0ABU7XS21_9FLAO|nr:SusC/RagA family TonB-linked outer membrane protein [Flavivirga sp. MEBiC05379]MDO5977642.1 SusC/RagA family TonB-linked outer membrane protein [Flavivirga sp. MEBiC05379]